MKMRANVEGVDNLEIAKLAETQWMSDSMFNTKEQVYSRVNDSTCQRQLDLSGRSNLEYYIKVNKKKKQWLTCHKKGSTNW